MPPSIDRYRIIRQLGEGGMSEVFEAVHLALGKRVALKLLRRELTADADALERFRREARTTGALGHPHIVRVLDFGEADDGSPYIAMEWLDGETLAAQLAREPLSVERALEIGEDVCDGLAAAHAAGVVHRDVKPANVMLCHDARGQLVPKLLDFGIAKLTRSDPGLTRTGAFVGTPAYMSPEQALGEEVDARADVYAVGVLLYEMLTGSRPFDGDDLMALIHAHAIERPQPPSQRAPARALGPALDALVLRCLEKEPARRFASIAALGAALHQLRVGSPLADEAPRDATGSTTGSAVDGVATARMGDATSSPPLVAPPARAQRRWRGALVALLVGTALGGALLVLRAHRAAPDGIAADAPVWKVLSQEAELETTAWVRPVPIAPGARFELVLELVPREQLRARWQPPLAVEVAFADQGGDLATTRRAELTADGHAGFLLTLPRIGTYHARIAVVGPNGTLAVTTLALCVGADPLEPTVALARTCPGVIAR